jgi:hypothetical protein
VSDGVVVSLLVLSVLIGIGGASFLVFRSPAFWGDVIKELFSKAWPQIWAILSKPESPEVRKARQRCERMGGKWDWHRKKCDR